mmetsp:Transcript_20241/g.20351  ORF Transcript_20241/g.20351 Transcript_20241/m.20351 type:complete len:93 (-) Transcript_20241:385-663(-)
MLGNSVVYYRSKKDSRQILSKISSACLAFAQPSSPQGSLSLRNPPMLQLLEPIPNISTFPVFQQWLRDAPSKALPPEEQALGSHRPAMQGSL